MFELCGLIGCPHPDYLNQMLTSEQIAEWRAFDLISPIGEKRTDFHVARQLSMMLNIGLASNSGKRKPKMTSPEKFMPDWDGSMAKSEKAKKELPIHEQVLDAFIKMKGTKDKRTKKEK